VRGLGGGDVAAFPSGVCVVDIPMQRSALANVWRNRRWGLWVAGTVFAIVLANYWIADEIYPDVH